MDFDQSGGFQVPLVVGERQGQRLRCGIGRERHLGGDRGRRVPVVAPEPVFGVVHHDVDGQGKGGVSPGPGEGDGGGAALDDGCVVGGHRDEGAAAGRVVDLDCDVVGIPLGVADGAVHLTDALDIRYELVVAGLFDPVHVGIDGEFGMALPGLDGDVVVLGAGIDPETFLPVGLSGLDPDGYGPAHRAFYPVEGEYDALALGYGGHVGFYRDGAVAVPGVGRVDCGLPGPRFHGPVLGLLAGGQLVPGVVLGGPYGRPVVPVGFRLAVERDP